MKMTEISFAFPGAERKRTSENAPATVYHHDNHADRRRQERQREPHTPTSAGAEGERRNVDAAADQRNEDAEQKQSDGQRGLRFACENAVEQVVKHSVVLL